MDVYWQGKVCDSALFCGGSGDDDDVGDNLSSVVIIEQRPFSKSLLLEPTLILKTRL